MLKLEKLVLTNSDGLAGSPKCTMGRTFSVEFALSSVKH